MKILREKKLVLPKRVTKLLKDLAQEEETSKSIIIAGEIRAESLHIDYIENFFIDPEIWPELQFEKAEAKEEITLKIGVTCEKKLKKIAQTYNITEEQAITMLLYEQHKSAHGYPDTLSRCKRPNCFIK